MTITRRDFVRSATALSLSAIAPHALRSATAAQSRVVIHADSEIGAVRPEFHGHFAEHLGSCVYGGLWVGKNSPIPNINGYRRQAVEFLKQLGVPVLRWPGGCFADDYHWRDGIGPPPDRPKRVNIHWGGYVEDNSFGTHEFIGLCRLIGAEPYFAGNVGSGSPREMRDWIEYCNMPSGSTLADERAKNGAPDPFRVRYWGVGNEAWGCGGSMEPEVYADYYRQFSVYLRTYGGTDPFLIASGPNGNDAHWTRGFMGRGGDADLQGFSMHYYEGGADASTQFTEEHMNSQLATFTKVEQAVIDQRTVLDGYKNGRNVALIFDEWGVWDRIPREDESKFGKLWQQSTMRSAIAAALGLNIFNRQADRLYMCNIAQMVNVLQSLLLTDGPEGKNCIRTPTYHSFALFKAHRGKKSVRVETDDTSPLGLSVSASQANGELVLSFVNPRSDKDLNVSCTLNGASASAAAAQIISNSDWNACNTFDNPDQIVPQPHPVSVAASRLQFDLPRLSIATVTLKLA